MGRAWMGFIMLLGGWAVAQTLVSAPAQAQLDPNYYAETCPDLFRIVAGQMLTAMANDTRVAASLLRVHFHDCFVLGCDASVLLDNDASERNQIPNLGSLRNFEVIDRIKAALEAQCPNTVSCADVAALASFFGVVFTGGPIWVIPLGRRDGLRSSTVADLFANLPPPSSNLTALIGFFSSKNLSLTDLVALSGGHTIGDSRCVSFTTVSAAIDDDRLYNFSGTGQADPQLNSTYAEELRGICPLGPFGNVSDPNNTTGMDKPTPRTFDNSYFKNFLTNEQLFISDNSLFNDNTGNPDEVAPRSVTRQLVLDYAANQSLFFDDFVQGMIRMGNLNVTTGTGGEIRTNCSQVNPTSSTIVQPSSSESKPEKVSKELSQEAKDKFIEEIRNIVEKVKYEYLAKHLEKLVEGGVDSGSYLYSSF